MVQMESGDFDDDGDAPDSLQVCDGLQFANNVDREAAMQDCAFGDFGEYCTSNLADNLLEGKFDSPGAFPPKVADY